MNWRTVFPVDYLKFAVACVDIKFPRRPHDDATHMSTRVFPGWYNRPYYVTSLKPPNNLLTQPSSKLTLLVELRKAVEVYIADPTMPVSSCLDLHWFSHFDG